MKRRRDKILELAIKQEDNSNKSITPRRRRNTIHEIPSPQAFETVTTEHKATKPCIRSKRARSLFFGSQDFEKLAECPVDSLDECCTSAVQLQENKAVCRDTSRDDLHVIPTSSASPHYYKNMSLPCQEPSNCNSNVLIEPPPPVNENVCFLRSGVKTRGGMSRKTGIKILKSQKVDLHYGKVTLIDLEENAEGNYDLENKVALADLEEHTEGNDDIKNKVTLTDLEEKTEGNDDIMDEMRKIFEELPLQINNKEEKPNAKLPSSNNILTEEDLINMLELEDNDLEVAGDQENVSDNCLFSDASEDSTQLSENNNIDFYETLQLTDNEWKSERDPSVVPLAFDGYEKNSKYCLKQMNHMTISN